MTMAAASQPHIDPHYGALGKSRCHLDSFLASSALACLHWILACGHSMSASATSAQAATLVRDDSEETQELSHSPPFFGPRETIPNRFHQAAAV